MDDLIIRLSLDDKKLTQGIKNAERQIRTFERELSRSARGIADVERSTGTFLATLRDFTVGMAGLRYAVLDFYTIFLRLPLAIVKTGGEFERLRTQLEGVSTAIDKVADAKKLEGFVTALALNSPFQIQALTESMVRLKTAGIDPTNGSLLALTDAIAKTGGNSETLKRASVAIAQMAGKGVISMEELRQQLGEAVPNAIQVMSRSLGLSVAELTKLVSEGKISSEALKYFFIQLALETQGAGEKMMQTLPGQLEVLQTKIQLFFKEISGDSADPDSFLSIFKDQVKDLNEALSSSEGRVFAKDIGEALKSITVSIADAIRFMVEWRDEIATTAKVLISLFAIKKITDFVNGMRSSVTEAMANYRAQTLQTLGEERKAYAEKKVLALRNVQELDQIRLSLREKQRAMYEEQKRRIMELAALEKQVAANKNGVIRGSDGKFRSGREEVARQQAEIDRITQLMALGRDEMRLNQQKIDQQKRGLGELNTSLRQTNTAMTTVGTSTGAAAAKMGVATIAARGLGAAFNFMGGWIGLAITGITLIISAFQSMSGAIDDATSKIRSMIIEGKGIAEIQREIENLRNGGDRSTVLGSIRAAFNRFTSSDAELAEQKKQANQNADKMQAEFLEEEERRAVEATRKQVQSIRKQSNVKAEVAVSAIDQQLQAQLKAIEDGRRQADGSYRAATKAEVALVNKLEKDANKAKIAVQMNSLNESKAAIETQERTLSQAMLTATGSQRERIAASLQLVREQGEAIKTEIDNAKKVGDSALSSVLRQSDKAPKKSPIENLLERSRANLEASKQALNGMVDDTINLQALEDELYVKLSDDFGGADTAERREIAKNQALTKLNDNARSVKSSLQQLFADVTAEGDQINFALNNIGGDGKLTELQKTQSELAKLRRQIDDVRATEINFEGQKNAILTRVAINELNQSLIEFKRETQSLDVSLIKDDDARAIAEFNIESQKLADTFATEMRGLLTNKDTGALRELTELKPEELAKYNEAYDVFANLMGARARRLAEDLKTPGEQLADQWKDVTKNMKDATADWMEDSIDAFMEFTDTGKFEFSGLVNSILRDILVMRTKQVFADPLNSMFDGLGKVALGNMPKPGTDEVAQGIDFGSIFDSLKNGALSVAQGFDNLAGTGITNLLTSLGLQTTATTTAATTETSATATEASASTNAVISINALANAAVSAAAQIGGGSSGGLFSSVLGTFVGALGGAAGGVDTTLSTGNVGVDTGGGTFFGLTPRNFANGGIMTSFGEVPLRKYSNGGIADMPQAAIYGEGDMNEAFVPLPDGRSIPVTIRGGMQAPAANVQSNVSVNVINQSGTPVTAQQSAPRFDGKRMILDVVLQAASQPGQFRDGLKGALR